MRKPFLCVAFLVVGALLLVWLALIAVHVSPLTAVSDLFTGSVGNADHLGRTLAKMAPLLIAGLAVFVGLRAGLFNIGVEGQIVVGALACAVVAAKIPGVLGLVLGLVAGVAAGGLWALPAGLIKAYRGGHEVITTIMLNSVAGFLTLALASGPFKAKGQDSPSTADVLSHLPDVPVGGLHINLGLILGVLGVPILAFWLRNTVRGYELEAVGANPTAARFAGVDTARVIVKAMLLSGMIAGFAGVVQVMGYEGRFFPEISSGTGFDALGVALLAGGNAWGVIVSAFGFAILQTGSVQLAFDGVPKGMGQLLLGLLIVIAAAIRYRKVRMVA